MYHAGIGTFLQRDPLPQEGESWVGYSHEYVTQNLYRYVNNSPMNLVDPLGLIPPFEIGPFSRPEPPSFTLTNVYKWIYTGNPNASDEIYEAAIEAAGELVDCWWRCEVDTHTCVGGKILTTTEVVSGTISTLAARVPKLPKELFNPKDPYTSLARRAGRTITPPKFVNGREE